MPATGILRVGQVSPQVYQVYVSQISALPSFNFTTVTAAEIRVLKPSGATQTWSGAISGQTATGLTFTRTLATGDLDEAGTYTGYLLMTVPGGTVRSETENFFVAEEFADIASEDAPAWFIAAAIVSGGGGGTVPTGSGFYTVTSGVGDAAARAAAAGIYTWLATPSSANLAAALTDETGTGEVVFSTTPTFKTSVKVNNLTNTFAYTLTPAAIVANRTLTLPLLTGNDTMVTEAHAATLTNKSIDADTNTITNVDNADIKTGANIAVNKLAAGTDTHVLTTVAGVPTWQAPSGGGSVPTGTGFYTVTGGVMDAASAPYGTGALTFLATPSSANLRAMLTDESGTGEAIFSTSPTFKTGILLNNPANTFAYTFTPAAIAANRTITLPLLTAGDTMVTAAFTQTLTNKTISGASNTITNISLTTGVTGTLPVANGGTGITSLGAGVATWLGTPSSANLATAITDETGSGALMFGTAPTIKTTLTIRNPADTFSYTITPSAIAATRVLTLPLLTGADTFVTEAHTQTLTNKTIAAGSNTITGIANANVDAAAAIAGTKISPDFGSQLVQTSGDALATNILATGYFHTAGSPKPTTGNIRIENTHKITSRNNADSANVCIAQYSAGDVLFIGHNSGFGEIAYGTIQNSSAYTYFAIASSYYIHLEASEVRMGNPVVGDDTVYASHGAVLSAMTDADYTVPASEYKYYTIAFAPSGGTARTVTFPHPSSLARSYTKNIRGSTEKVITVSTGTGTTVAFSTTSKGRVFEFTNGGVRAAGPEYDL